MQNKTQQKKPRIQKIDFLDKAVKNMKYKNTTNMHAYKSTRNQDITSRMSLNEKQRKGFIENMK